jgi:hypothetical protein
MEVEFCATITTEANSEWSKKAEYIVLTNETFDLYLVYVLMQ